MKKKYFLFLMIMLLPLFPVISPAGEGQLDTVKIESLIMDLMQKERSLRKLTVFRPMEKLSMLARYHSRNMVERGFFSHIDHEGANPSTRKQKLYPGLLGGIGENIAYNFGDTEEEVAGKLMIQWMKSPGAQGQYPGQKLQLRGSGRVQKGQ